MRAVASGVSLLLLPLSTVAACGSESGSARVTVTTDDGRQFLDQANAICRAMTETMSTVPGDAPPAEIIQARAETIANTESGLRALSVPSYQADAVDDLLDGVGQLVLTAQKEVDAIRSGKLEEAERLEQETVKLQLKLNEQSLLLGLGECAK